MSRKCIACEADRRGVTPGEALAIGIAVARQTVKGLCADHAGLRPGKVQDIVLPYAKQETYERFVAGGRKMMRVLDPEEPEVLLERYRAALERIAEPGDISGIPWGNGAAPTASDVPWEAIARERGRIAREALALGARPTAEAVSAARSTLEDEVKRACNPHDKGHDVPGAIDRLVSAVRAESRLPLMKAESERDGYKHKSERLEKVVSMREADCDTLRQRVEKLEMGLERGAKLLQRVREELLDFKPSESLQISLMAASLLAGLDDASRQARELVTLGNLQTDRELRGRVAELEARVARLTEVRAKLNAEIAALEFHPQSAAGPFAVGNRVRHVRDLEDEEGLIISDDCRWVVQWNSGNVGAYDSCDLLVLKPAPAADKAKPCGIGCDPEGGQRAGDCQYADAICETCPDCDGTGHLSGEGAKGPPHGRCASCGGSGGFMVSVDNTAHRQTCEVCRGTGWRSRNSNDPGRCETCEGRGVVATSAASAEKSP